MHWLFLIPALIRRLEQYEQHKSQADSAEPWDDPDAAPPWWRVELSGIHLLLWVGAPFLAAGLSLNPMHPPLWMAFVGGFLLFGWFIKVMFWMQLLHDDDEAAIVQYRWFGTTEGTLAAAAVISAIGLLTWYALR
jgi:hypothetical protein